jgi:hypothetical protein
MTIRAVTISTPTMPAEPQLWGNMVESDRLCVLRAMDARPRSTTGSASEASVTSRLAPMPSKLDPVSKAATTVTNRITPSTYANATRSPVNARGAGNPPQGTSVVAASADANPTTGPARKTHDVVWLYTAPLRRSRARS